MKGLEGKTYEERLWSLGLFSLEAIEGRPLHSLPLSHEKKMKVRFTCLLSGDGWQDSKMVWSWIRGGLGWIAGKDFSPRRCLSTGTSSPCKWSQHQPEFEKHLDKTQAHGVTLGLSGTGSGVRICLSWKALMWMTKSMILWLRSYNHWRLGKCES